VPAAALAHDTDNANVAEMILLVEHRMENTLAAICRRARDDRGTAPRRCDPQLDPQPARPLATTPQAALPMSMPSGERPLDGRTQWRNRSEDPPTIPIDTVKQRRELSG
jgi:hypothetical protein